jgi:hypothetical protein
LYKLPLALDRDIVLCSGQPLKKHGLVFTELVDSLFSVSKEYEKHCTVLPFQRVDHVFGGKDAAVVFSQDRIARLPQGNQIGHSPHHHQPHEDKDHAIANQYFLFQRHKTFSCMRSKQAPSKTAIIVP